MKRISALSYSISSHAPAFPLCYSLLITVNCELTTLMRKLLSFLIGSSLGVAAGMLLVTFFSPVSGRQLRANMRTHYLEAMNAARKAAADKRAELEKELAEMKNPPALPAGE